MTPAIDLAVLRALRALETPDGQSLRDYDLATVIKEMALDQVESVVAPLEDVRREVSVDRPDLLRRATEEIQATVSQVDAAFIRDIAAHPRFHVEPRVLDDLLRPERAADLRRFLDRTGQLAFEGVLTESVAPEVRLRIGRPMQPEELCRCLPGEFSHAVVLGEIVGASGEVFPLMLDAYAHDLAAHGRVFLNVVSVAQAWLTEGGRARRIQFFDPARRWLWETELEEPLALSSCHFLCLGRSNEREIHRQLSALLGALPQVNPWAASERCDDKYRTYGFLKAAGVLTPATVLIQPGQSREQMTQQLVTAGIDCAKPVVVQPNLGTEGRGVISLTLGADGARWLGTTVAGGALIGRQRLDGLRYPTAEETRAADVRINVCWDGSGYRAESAYVQVAGNKEAVVSSVGEGGRIVTLSEGVLESLGLSEPDLAVVSDAACAAAWAVAEGLGDRERLGLVGVDLRLERQDGRLLPWVLDLNPRPAGLSYSELLESREPGVSPRVFAGITATLLTEAWLGLARSDADDDHRHLLDAAVAIRAVPQVARALADYLRLEPSSETEPNLCLLQQRALFLMGDVLHRSAQGACLPETPELKRLVAAVSSNKNTQESILYAIAACTDRPRTTDYEEFIAPFLAAANERELCDFDLAKHEVLDNAEEATTEPLRIVDPGASFIAEVPMRVGISSANASDNWTFAKLRGGKVVNFSVDLAPDEATEPRPPIRVTVEALDEPALELETRSQLETDRPTRVKYSEANAFELLAVPPGERPARDKCYRDLGDPLLMLKYALSFTGVVRWRSAPDDYLSRPERVIEEVRRFAGGNGLRIRVTSGGPSRSGFASSSSVALGLLAALYRASGQQAFLTDERLSSLALLFENELGLKSGKQDTDGPLYPGLKAITYPPTAGFLRSDIVPLAVDEVELRHCLVIADSGIQRPPASGLRRGLNMRHLSYLSRHPDRYPAILQSLQVHDRIVEALELSDWESLGKLFSRYLALREAIDPGATRSRYDAEAGQKVLRAPFAQLMQQGLIHGGMYTGAMGGGGMLLVVTPRGREPVSGGRAVSRLDAALEELRHQRFGAQCPFVNLEIYRYAVNTRGLVCSTRPRSTGE